MILATLPRRSRPLACSAVLALGALAAHAQTAPTSDALASELDAYTRLLDRAGELSGTLLVGQGGSVVYERSFGRADVEAERANDPATVFAIASLTKPLTAMVAERMVAAGKLRFEDPLSKWIPDFPRGDEITVLLLRQHRSGLPHRVTTLEEELQPQSAESMVRIAARATLRFEPGTQNLYSSAGYTVLARVLELAGGKPYAELLHEYVLGPTGATRTFSTSGAFPADVHPAKGYFGAPGGPRPAPGRNLSFLTGAGSVYSTPRDLFRVVRGLADGVLQTSHREALPQGLFWNGISNGYRAFVQYIPEGDFTLVWTANLYTGAGDLLRRDLPLILAGRDVPPGEPPKIVPVALAEEGRRALEGAYQFGPSGVQELRFLDPKLAMLGTEYLMVPVGPDVFVSPADYSTLTVEHDEQHAVTGFRWESGGQSMSFPRLR